MRTLRDYINLINEDPINIDVRGTQRAAMSKINPADYPDERAYARQAILPALLHYKKVALLAIQEILKIGREELILQLIGLKIMRLENIPHHKLRQLQ